ncbi:MAG: tRNA (adenosine(37)-N6)-dimethylallyltransferase MiaA, partial [Lachnospiraceae bacterium]|nr:tRNA (adenosine(37)-N6)-dimethylallyltransferase MiaA [Lachnospiraceae bacterium]
TSMQGIGYKQMLMYLNGEVNLDEAISLIKRDSRHYAKRQLTWFNREHNLIWIDRQQYLHTSDICEALLTSILT